MKRAHRIEATIVAILILAGTTILVYQFYFNRDFLYGQARFLFENKRYGEAVPKYLNFLSRFGDGEHVEEAKDQLRVCTYNRLADLEGKVTKIGRRLDAIAEIVASKHGGIVDVSPMKLMLAVQVLDKDTLEPLQGVRFLFPGSGYCFAKTDLNGVLHDRKALFQNGREVYLYHPSYEIQCESGYRCDSAGMITFLMRQAGTASLVVKATLTVRGERTDYPCRLVLLRKGISEGEVRRIERDEDRICHLSGLAPGEYTIEAYFWDAYTTHYEPVRLKRGEHKVVEINAKTDERRRIMMQGVVLNKRNGKPIEGVRVSFRSASTVTDGKGTFSTDANRGGFRQSYLRFGKECYVLLSIDNRISEDMAKKLEFHVDPEVSYENRGLNDKDGDGIFCELNGCVICEKR